MKNLFNDFVQRIENPEISKIWKTHNGVKKKFFDHHDPPWLPMRCRKKKFLVHRMAPEKNIYAPNWFGAMAPNGDF